jgi:hypothetical protein
MREYLDREVEIAGEYEAGKPLIKCCLALRCKSRYSSGVERPGLIHESDVMTYWCEHTQQANGPDFGDTHPRACQSDRSCFEK